LGMGQIYERQGQWTLAEQAYKQLVSLVPDREAGYKALARVLQQSGQEDIILPLYLEAARTFFWLTWPKTRLSDAYLALGRSEQAATALRAALRLDTGDVFTLVRLARLYRVERALDLALSFGLQAENRAYTSHEFAQAHFELGQVYWARGDNEIALVHFLKTAELLPDIPVHHATIGDFYLLAENDPQAALPNYLKAASLAPDNASYQLTLGDIYRSLGDDQKAIQAFQNALLLNPELPGLQERLWENP